MRKKPAFPALKEMDNVQRSTQSLPAVAIDLLNYITQARGITKKDVFDQICEFFTLPSLRAWFKADHWIQQIFLIAGSPSVRKTFVFSESAHQCLERYSNELQLERKHIIMNGLLLHAMLVWNKRKSKINKYTSIATQLREQSTAMEEVLATFQTPPLLENDPLQNHIQFIADHLKKVLAAVEAEIRLDESLDPTVIDIFRNHVQSSQKMISKDLHSMRTNNISQFLRSII